MPVDLPGIGIKMLMYGIILLGLPNFCRLLSSLYQVKS
jgi:hypothetical protein